MPKNTLAAFKIKNEFEYLEKTFLGIQISFINILIPCGYKYIENLISDGISVYYLMLKVDVVC
jgi:hypothetical protein